MPLAVIGCWRVTTRPPRRTGPGRRSASARVRHRAKPVEHTAVQADHLAPGVEPDDRVGVADPLRLGEGGQRRRVGRRQAEVHRPAGDPAPHRAAHGARDLAELPEELAPRPAQRVQRPDPDQPLERLLRQARPLDDVRQRRVRPARQLGVEQLLVLLADPLHEAQPQPHAPADRALGRPQLAGLAATGITQAAERTGSGRRSMPASPGSRLVVARRRRPARPAHPLGRRLVARSG